MRSGEGGRKIRVPRAEKFSIRNGDGLILSS